MSKELIDPHLRIVPYSREYPKIFCEIKRFLRDIIPYSIEVEHIGSTAVPRLGGRDIIDILVVVEKKYMQEVAELLESRGFKHNPRAGVPHERFFVSGPYKYRDRELHIHIHITFPGSREHRDKLLFRDYLIRHPDEARSYYEFKRECMRKAGLDPSKYRKLKDAYIKVVLEKAREEDMKLREQALERWAKDP